MWLQGYARLAILQTYGKQQTGKNDFLCARYRGNDPGFRLLFLGTSDSLTTFGFDRTAPVPALRIKVGMASPRKRKSADVASAAVPAEQLTEAFPKLNLPIQPPYAPAEAKSAESLAPASGWLYEPKWDGFRCLAFRRGDEVVLQSKAGQPLGRYFPEIVAALLA